LAALCAARSWVTF